MKLKLGIFTDIHNPSHGYHWTFALEGEKTRVDDNVKWSCKDKITNELEKSEVDKK